MVIVPGTAITVATITIININNTNIVLIITVSTIAIKHFNLMTITPTPYKESWRASPRTAARLDDGQRSRAASDVEAGRAFLPEL